MGGVWEGGYALLALASQCYFHIYMNYCLISTLSLPKMTPRPTFENWWSCCQCGRDVNESLWGTDCPDCTHTTCNYCTQTTRAPPPRRPRRSNKTNSSTYSPLIGQLGLISQDYIPHAPTDCSCTCGCTCKPPPPPPPRPKHSINCDHFFE